MLAAPEAAAWAEHAAARAGKLEKRGRLKDEWKARHFELRGCYLVCFADAKEGRPALAVFDVTKVACARDANDPDDVFGLRVLEGSIKLRASDKTTRRAWMAAICQAQEQHFEERRRRSRDEGDFDAVVADAPPGDGYWALPEEWGVASNMLAGGGITLLNDVPAL